MKLRMKTGVVPIKTFLVVGEKIVAEKSGFQKAIPTTWLLFALFYVITIFCNSRGELRKIDWKKSKCLMHFCRMLFKILQFYIKREENFFLDRQIKKHYIIFSNQKFLFAFIQFISILLFKIIIFFFNELQKILLLFLFISIYSFCLICYLKLLFSSYLHIYCFFLSMNHKID